MNKVIDERHFLCSGYNLVLFMFYFDVYFVLQRNCVIKKKMFTKTVVGLWWGAINI